MPLYTASTLTLNHIITEESVYAVRECNFLIATAQQNPNTVLYIEFHAAISACALFGLFCYYCMGGEVHVVYSTYLRPFSQDPPTNRNAYEYGHVYIIMQAYSDMQNNGGDIMVLRPFQSTKHGPSMTLIRRTLNCEIISVYEFIALQSPFMHPNQPNCLDRQGSHFPSIEMVSLIPKPKLLIAKPDAPILLTSL